MKTLSLSIQSRIINLTTNDIVVCGEHLSAAFNRILDGKKPTKWRIKGDYICIDNNAVLVPFKGQHLLLDDYAVTYKFVLFLIKKGVEWSWA